MCFKIVLVITLITTCLAAPPLLPKSKSNQATYSQNFVREDVPLSYQYSAVHEYASKKQEDTPKAHGNTLRHEVFLRSHGHEAYNNNNAVKNLDLPFKPLINKTFQFAPLPTHSRAPVLYTSTIPNPDTKIDYSEQSDLNENSAGSALSLEPIDIVTETKNVNPSTYRPHMNHDIKMFQSEQSHLWAKKPTERTPQHAPMVGLHHLALYQQIQQHLRNDEPNYMISSPTNNPKFSHIINLGVRVLPKQDGAFATTSPDFIMNTPFQPIPRIAYHSKFQVAPEKIRIPKTQMYQNQMIHFL